VIRCRDAQARENGSGSASRETSANAVKSYRSDEGVVEIASVGCTKTVVAEGHPWRDTSALANAVKAVTVIFRFDLVSGVEFSLVREAPGRLGMRTVRAAQRRSVVVASVTCSGDSVTAALRLGGRLPRSHWASQLVR
jgi:hypothetical protein